MMEKKISSGLLGSSETLDEARLERKTLMKRLSSPSVLFPFLLGATMMAALWTFSIKSAIMALGALACMLGAVGIFFTGLLLGGGSLKRETLEEMQREVERKREETLDDLQRKLRLDGDHRTEKCLQDLRALAKAFRQNEIFLGDLNDSSTYDILAGVDKLFRRSVLSLEKTLAINETAGVMVTKAAREPILRQRDRIVEDVIESISQLGKILAGIHAIGANEGSEESDLAKIRHELDRSLEVAKTVDQRMKNLEREIGDKEM